MKFNETYKKELEADIIAAILKFTEQTGVIPIVTVKSTAVELEDNRTGIETRVEVFA